MPWQHIVILAIWFLAAAITAVGAAATDKPGAAVGPFVMVTLLTILLVTGDNALSAG